MKSGTTPSHVDDTARDVLVHVALSENTTIGDVPTNNKNVTQPIGDSTISVLSYSEGYNDKTHSPDSTPCKVEQITNRNHSKNRSNCQLMTEASALTSITQNFAAVSLCMNTGAVDSDVIGAKITPTFEEKVSTENLFIEDCCHQYDNLLFFFKFMFFKIHDLYGSENLRAYK